MSVYVVLIDDNTETATVVQCVHQAEAERVGAAAVYSDGGVSAYRLPDSAIVADLHLIDMLRAGHDLEAIGLAPSLVGVRFSPTEGAT